MARYGDQGAGLSRRDFLRGAGGVAVGAGVGPLRAAGAARGDGPAGKALRFVHLSDIHLMKERRAPAGLAACLDSLAKLDPKPAFIVTGGDQCDNLRSLDLRGAEERLDLFVKVWRDHTDLPTYHCLGNHDPAGWGNQDFPRDHPQFGMKLMMDRLGMKDRFYSFSRGGWHFVVLDNIHLTEPGKFVGEFAGEQLDFLRGDLREHQKEPTIVICHVPPISAEELLGGKIKAGKDGWDVPYTRVCKNPADLVGVLAAGNVRFVLSGHIHHVERIETHGQTFICGGAVAGDWWKGPLRGCPAGFGIIDCKPDGTFAYQYQDFGWKAGG
jgi:3',5'-cyclic-AMP phosphodiesterase